MRQLVLADVDESRKSKIRQNPSFPNDGAKLWYKKEITVMRHRGRKDKKNISKKNLEA